MNGRFLLGLGVGLCILSGCETLSPQPPATEPMPPLVTVREDFDLAEPGDSWTLRTRGQWRIAIEDGAQFLQMAFPISAALAPQTRNPPAPVAQTLEWAIYNRYQFRSFSLSCQVRVAGPERTGARDACILFGWADPDHGYRIDLSAQTDLEHNALIRLSGQTRQVLATVVPGKPGLTSGWHRVDVLRDADAGTIRVYVDPAGQDAAPVLQAVDHTYEWGRLGLGSFDHADFSRFLIQGQARLLPHSLPQ